MTRRSRTNRRTRRKYLRRKQRGGVGKTFTIYTTGITDAGALDKDSIIDKWINMGVLDNILRNIPEKYTHIEIIHFDPLVGADVAAINATLCDYELTQPRVKTSVFNNENFDVESLLPILENLKDYIIIDCAHIFEPTDTPKQYRYGISKTPGCAGGHICANYSPERGYNESQIRVGKFNVVYLGYLGTKSPTIGNSVVEYEMNKYFDVLDDGNITTFVEQLRAVGLPSNVDEPLAYLNDVILGKIQRDIKPKYERGRENFVKEPGNARTNFIVRVDKEYRGVWRDIFLPIFIDEIKRYFNDPLWRGIPFARFIERMNQVKAGVI